jgi:hypothetical protein
MTMLTFTRGPFERARHASTRPDATETEAAGARLASIKQFCVCAFTVLLAMAAVAGVIALKAAVYLSRLNFHP